MSERKEYDPAADAVGSYYAAVEAKRLRGDTHWPGSSSPLVGEDSKARLAASEPLAALGEGSATAQEKAPYEYPSPRSPDASASPQRGDLSSPTRGEEGRRATFDWPAFGAALRAQLAECNPGLRALGVELGITASDISRASNGVPVRIEKVMALCDWMGRAERDFYSAKSTRCSARHVKQGAGE